jgi:PhzF family phenazine biosynthesis protein
MKDLAITVVDAFTDEPFRGNPAAVCLLPEPLDEVRMQAIAREMNLSETAFLVRRPDGFELRWFTPEAEVDLCGHATLASAHVLWEQGVLGAGEPARFYTRSGLLTAGRAGDWIEMDFPALPVQPVDDPPRGLVDALGVQPRYLGKNTFDFLVEVDSEEEVRCARPDFTLLGRVAVRGIALTSRASSPAYDFVSRFFAPAVGINEDPVTGSAHCSLGPFWGARLEKQELLGYQASSRGGYVRVRMAGDRVLLGGRAVTILDCRLRSDLLPQRPSGG